MPDTLLGTVFVPVSRGHSIVCFHGICGLRGEDGHSSNKHTGNVYAQIVISPLKERNNLDEGGNLGRALSGDKI